MGQFSQDSQKVSMEIIESVLFVFFLAKAGENNYVFLGDALVASDLGGFISRRQKDKHYENMPIQI